jgi:hypothetical protein
MTVLTNAEVDEDDYIVCVDQEEKTSNMRLSKIENELSSLNSKVSSVDAKVTKVLSGHQSNQTSQAFNPTINYNNCNFGQVLSQHLQLPETNQTLDVHKKPSLDVAGGRSCAPKVANDPVRLNRLSVHFETKQKLSEEAEKRKREKGAQDATALSIILKDPTFTGYSVKDRLTARVLADFLTHKSVNFPNSMRKQRAKLIELVEGLQDQKDPAA